MDSIMREWVRTPPDLSRRSYYLGKDLVKNLGWPKSAKKRVFFCFIYIYIILYFILIY
nr:MAG TPA: hypothetical protein [Caudoviricetes sp.]